MRRICWPFYLQQQIPEQALNALDQHILWYLDPDVLARPRATSFPRALCRVEAQIDIRTLEVIEGDLPKRALALVLEWASDHRSELLEDWELCARMQTPKKIAPLS
jgi:hypothetical protein